jgi:tRNA(Ile)-lysidine synthase
MLIDRIKNTITKYALLKTNDRVVLGVSGGPDSLTMLYALHSLAKEYNLTLHVVHVNHKLRKNSGLDAEFVKRICVSLGIPATIKKVDIRRLAVKGSVEEIAREQRMRLLFEVGRKIKAHTIALGHNLDDQAETVLMRLLRGSGLHGLSGILPKRLMDNGYTLIRPLIEIRRKDIETYLKRKKIKPRIDESNFQDIYLRNRIRLHLLPLLERKYNKNIRDILCTTAHVAADDYDLLLMQAQRVSRDLGARIPIKKFKLLHPSMQKLVLRLNFQRLKGNTRTLSYRHINELDDLILNRPINSIVDLPSGISVVKKKEILRFYLR